MPANVPAHPQAIGTPPRLQYLRTTATRVRGEVSGRYYDFSGSRPAQHVDRRDLPGLMRTGFFRQG